MGGKERLGHKRRNTKNLIRGSVVGCRELLEIRYSYQFLVSLLQRSILSKFH